MPTPRQVLHHWDGQRLRSESAFCAAENIDLLSVRSRPSGAEHALMLRALMVKDRVIFTDGSATCGGVLIDLLLLVQ